ncbi:DUF4321 domain-containing protein [Tindallia californiensis]|uniref:DUF4321 domain-containing protein n=1 Tax=Tindallia californiensis TaxID=159292 RepID=A0A1H3NDH4_9FIRM|nr:DUF4321 domain-containing protein [Tindallia californiensis]SDY86239.1 protein of unknown function [Tindallia californiensis]
MNKHKNIGWLFITIVTGVLIGSLIGSLLGKALPILTFGPGPLGINNVSADFGIVVFNFSFMIYLNLAGLIGLILAIILFKKI